MTLSKRKRGEKKKKRKKEKNKEYQCARETEKKNAGERENSAVCLLSNLQVSNFSKYLQKCH